MIEKKTAIPMAEPAPRNLERHSSWPPLSPIGLNCPHPFVCAEIRCNADCIADNSKTGTLVMPPRPVFLDPKRADLDKRVDMDKVTAEFAESIKASVKKDTNPKDGIGATKLPLTLVPATATALASLAHLDGALKYGAWNWRIAGVRASIYVDACKRHLDKWFNGEELDEDSYVEGQLVEGSGLPHLAHAMACLNILVDAMACGKLNDDRPPAVDINLWLSSLTPHVAELKLKHAGRSPEHFTIRDSEG